MKKAMVSVSALALFLLSLSGCGGNAITASDNSENLLSSTEEIASTGGETNQWKRSPADGDISLVDAGSKAGFYTVGDSNGRNIGHLYRLRNQNSSAFM